MRYRVRRLDPGENTEVVARLWRTNLRDARINGALERRLQWFYKDGPAGGASTWLVEDDSNGRAVGCGSVMPRTLLLKGEMTRAGMLADFAVDPEHRVGGAALSIQRAIANEAWDLGLRFLFAYPSRAASAVFQRVGYRTVGTNVVWTLPLKCASKLGTRLPPALVRPFAAVLDRVLAFDREVQRVWRQGRYGAFICDEPGDELDDLWAREARAFPIAGVRDVSYLRWRYAQHPTEEYGLFELLRGSGREAVGYIAFSIRDATAFVADMFCGANGSMLEAMMVRFVAFARQRGLAAVHVSLVGGQWLGECLRRLHFLRGHAEGRPLMVCCPAGGWSAELGDPANWVMTEGELDI
jgi:GNAT superfamily N-acetyltransferase